jgi:hypothetical protein
MVAPVFAIRFELIIDGCNGPIRFREDCLRRAATPASSVLDCTGDKVRAETAKVSAGNDDDVDDTILSLLRPESIVVDKQKERIGDNSGAKNRSKRKKKNKPRSKPCASEDTTSDRDEDSPNRLDMLPLLLTLLRPYKRKDREEHPLRPQLFDSILVVFDGISTTKRHPVPGRNQKQNNQHLQQVETIEEEAVRGRLWHVTSDTTKVSIPILANEADLCNVTDSKSGCLGIGVTGLYDEADNVIVDRIRERHRREVNRDNQQYPMGSDQVINVTGRVSRPLGAVTSIQILRRTERGAGKNRRLFLPLGLLRPESVACVFEFDACVSTTTADCNEYPEEDVKSKDNELRQLQSRRLSSSFSRLALDGNQTLRSVRRRNPTNVFLTLDEPLEVHHGNNRKNGIGLMKTIVATDDVFLRQRIVHEGGYVMTFHQLWLLLLDVMQRLE